MFSRRGLHLAVAILVLTAVATVAGTADEPTVTLESRSAGLVLVVQVPKRTKAGEPIVCRMKLSNERDKAVVYDDLEGLHGFALEVIHGDHQSASLTEFGAKFFAKKKSIRLNGVEMPVEGGSADFLQLGPGESVTGECTLSRMYDLSVARPYSQTVRIVCSTVIPVIGGGPATDIALSTKPLAFEVFE